MDNQSAHGRAPHWWVFGLGAALLLIGVLIVSNQARIAAAASAEDEVHGRHAGINNLRIALSEALSALGEARSDMPRYQTAVREMSAQMAFAQARSDAAGAHDLTEVLALLEHFSLQSGAVLSATPADRLRDQRLRASDYAQPASKARILLEALERKYAGEAAQSRAALAVELTLSRIILGPALIAGYLLVLVIAGYLLHTLRRQRAAVTSLRAAVEAGANAAHSRSTSLAGMSLAIRTLVTSIQGTSNLSLTTALTLQQRDHVDAIRHSARMLLRLADDLLTLGKSEAGELTLQVERLDLTRCIEGVFRRFHASAAIKSVALSYHIEPGVPHTLLGDELRLTQILANLMDNALKFTPSGTVRLEVRQAARWHHRLELEFKLADSGVGIDRERLPALFSLPQAGEDALAEPAGNGLGLAISAKLVSLMGGRIELESERGAGSVFRFTVILQVPAPGSEANTDEPVLPIESADPISAHSPMLRVLAVDDSIVHRQTVLEMLGSMGCQTDLSANGLEALEAVKRNSYDLVLMALKMPRMDGLEATRRIVSMLPAAYRPHIVAMTTDLAAERAACLEAGMQRCLEKPLTLTALSAVVSEARIRTSIAQAEFHQDIGYSGTAAHPILS